MSPRYSAPTQSTTTSQPPAIRLKADSKAQGWIQISRDQVSHMCTQKTLKNKGERFFSALDRHAIAGANVWPSAHSINESDRVRIADKDLAENRHLSIAATFGAIAIAISLGFVFIRPCPLHKKTGGGHYRECAGSRLLRRENHPGSCRGADQAGVGPG